MIFGRVAQKVERWQVKVGECPRRNPRKALK